MDLTFSWGFYLLHLEEKAGGLVQSCELWEEREGMLWDADRGSRLRRWFDRPVA